MTIKEEIINTRVEDYPEYGDEYWRGYRKASTPDYDKKEVRMIIESNLIHGNLDNPIYRLYMRGLYEGLAARK